jgi:predicted RNA-binding Zn-ribbon protein involved in translation (DUF1610 family)
VTEYPPPFRAVGIERNAARCRSCGDEIESTHRHDFRSCSCGDLSVDGGKAYIKRGYRSGTTWDELTVCHHSPNPYMPEQCQFCGASLDSESAPSAQEGGR